MAGRIITLSKPRALNGRGLIIPSIRADITDYGTPGDHLHGPLALRGRDKAISLRIPGADAGDGDGGLGGLLGCMPLGGGSFTNVESVAASTVNVRVSAQIPTPFLIHHIYLFSDQALGVSVSFTIHIADDNDISGGLLTTGQNIFMRIGGNSRADFNNAPKHIYPNYLAKEAQKYIKAIISNESGGTIVLDYVVEIIFLPS